MRLRRGFSGAVVLRSHGATVPWVELPFQRVYTLWPLLLESEQSEVANDLGDSEIVCAALPADAPGLTADGSGEIDAAEAASLFASYCEPGASAAQIQRTANNLMSTLDTDRSGRLSFEEFAFRFARGSPPHVCALLEAATDATPAPLTLEALART